MPFMLSPGVQVVEKDLTSIIPAVANSIGAFAGVFSWGPVLDPTTVTSENELVTQFGKPQTDTATSFFTAANFLAYSNNLLLVRLDTANSTNAIALSGGGATKIKNRDDYDANYAGGGNDVGMWAAKYPGVLGNSISVYIADSNVYSKVWSESTKLKFDGAPGTSTYAAREGGSNDELHILVVDTYGKWTGAVGAVLEKFQFVSKARDAKLDNGTNNYYKDVINTTSKYIWWMDHHPAGTNWGSAAKGVTFANAPDTGVNAAFNTVNLVNGVDDLTATDSEIETGYALFANSEAYDVSLIMAGAVTPNVAKYVVELAEARRDAVAFISPVDDTGSMIQGTTVGEVVSKTVRFRHLGSQTNLDWAAVGQSFNVNSSYAVLDSGWKYQYDRYNDVYRWVPLNGDIAGLCARTDLTNDPWWSPGGLNRGQIRNVVKLSLTPNQSQRDTLYVNGINPVVSFPGQGTVLFGDKTLLNKPSAFDRVNVRRLFIVLEKAIARASKYQLFEFNDNFTRAQFRGMVEPFLRDVQGRRGVQDFRVKCDTTNNTGEVIDRNEFIADIYIKPNRSINFITLNFVATRSGISFDEIGA